MSSPNNVRAGEDLLGSPAPAAPRRHVSESGGQWSARTLLPDAAAEDTDPTAAPSPGAPTAAVGAGASADGPSVSLMTVLWWYRRLSAGVLAGATVLGALAGLILQAPPTAVAQIAVLDPRGNTVLRQGVTSETSFQTYTEQRAIFAQSTEVLSLAAAKLSAQGLTYTVGELRQQVRATVSDSGALINVSASADAGKSAVGIADAVVASYQDLTRRDLQSQVQAQDEAVAEAIGSLSRTIPKGVPSSVSSSAAASTIAQLQARAANAAVDASSALDGTRFVVAAQVLPAGRLSALGKGAATGGAAGLLAVIVLGYALADRVPAVRIRRRGASLLGGSGGVPGQDRGSEGPSSFLALVSAIEGQATASPTVSSSASGTGPARHDVPSSAGAAETIAAPARGREAHPCAEPK
jgi:capsular polysaccharide biosynthesis protein